MTHSYLIFKICNRSPEIDPCRFWVLLHDFVKYFDSFIYNDDLFLVVRDDYFEQLHRFFQRFYIEYEQFTLIPN